MISKMNTRYDSPIGAIQIQGTETHITHIQFTDKPETSDNWSLGEITIQQLTEYFTGQRTQFDIPLQAKGTPFQQNVWKTLQRIPFGETQTYGEIARLIGNPKAARAVGLANNRNPIAIAIPCHRVIGTNGKLTGYAGGLERKEFLLKLEHE